MTGRPPSPGPGDPVERRITGLSRDIERMRRQVTELDQLVRRLGSDIAAIARPAHGSPAAGEPSSDEVLGVRSWLLVEDRDRAESDLIDLIAWLDRVYLAYPGVVLPACWLWHPAVIEELWWLRCTHADAYHPSTGTWARVGDWHDRLRPNVVERLHKEIGSCDVVVHTPERKTSKVRQLRTPLRSAVPLMAAWAAAGRPGQVPDPTEHDLEAAKQYHSEKYGGPR